MPDVFTGLRRANPGDPHSKAALLPTTRKTPGGELAAQKAELRTEGRRLFDSPPAAAATPGAPQASTVRRAPPPLARPTTPSAGGTMQRAGGPALAVPPTAPRTPGVNSGGTITRSLTPGVNATTIVPPSASQPRTVQSAPVQPAPQTEAANPLVGDTTTQPEDTTSAVDPAQAAGFSSRGPATPKGADAVGGTGIFQRRFSNPASAGIYDKYVRRLFGNEAGIVN